MYVPSGVIKMRVPIYLSGDFYVIKKIVYLCAIMRTYGVFRVLYITRYDSTPHHATYSSDGVLPVIGSTGRCVGAGGKDIV